MEINYSFKLLIALFLLSNLNIAGAAEDESGFGAAARQAGLSFFGNKYCKVCNECFEGSFCNTCFKNRFKEYLSSHAFPIQVEETDDEVEDWGEDTARDRKELFKCKDCDKSFAYGSDLKRHEKVHTGEKPFQCDQCGQSFAQNSHLKVHERVHTGERPYRCDKCEKSFSQKANLKRHQSVHAGERSYSCDQCEKSFTTSYNFKRHQKVHAGEKLYQCDECDKSFSQKANLKKHKKVHAKQALQAEEDDHE